MNGEEFPTLASALLDEEFTPDQLERLLALVRADGRLARELAAWLQLEEMMAQGWCWSRSVEAFTDMVRLRILAEESEEKFVGETVQRLRNAVAFPVFRFQWRRLTVFLLVVVSAVVWAAGLWCG